MHKKILGGILIVCVILSGSACLFAQEEPPEVAPGRVEQEEELPPRPPMGLRVQPGGLLVQYVPLGVTYNFYEAVGIPLTIYNRDVNPHTYILSTDKPSTVAARKWLKGYLEIPDPSWFWFDKDEVKVEANSKAEIKMYLKIPDEEKYYNQHWTVSLGVKGKSEAGQMIALALYPRVQIETLSKEDVKVKPDGIIGFVPGILSFENLPLGQAKKVKVKLYNNDKKGHKYKIKAMMFPVAPTRELITTSPTYSWIPNTKWVKPSRRRISIAANESKELFIKVKIPDERENYNKKWEAIIFVESKKGLPGFVRVQIQTEKEEENEE